MSRDFLNQRKIVSKKFSCGKVCGKYIRKYEAECSNLLSLMQVYSSTFDYLNMKILHRFESPYTVTTNLLSNVIYMKKYLPI